MVMKVKGKQVSSLASCKQNVLSRIQQKQCKKTSEFSL